jgi:hypothetical protein
MILSDVALKYDEYSKDEVRSGRVNDNCHPYAFDPTTTKYMYFLSLVFFGFQSNEPPIYTQTKVIFVAFKSCFFTFTVRTCLCYIGD